MPSPVYNFDLVCNRDQSLPTVCLGVYKTSDPNRFRLHMVDLNNDEIKPPPYPFLREYSSFPISSVILVMPQSDHRLHIWSRKLPQFFTSYFLLCLIGK